MLICNYTIHADTFSDIKQLCFHTSENIVKKNRVMISINLFDLNVDIILSILLTMEKFRGNLIYI